jgi:hypothetical protein
MEGWSSAFALALRHTEDEMRKRRKRGERADSCGRMRLPLFFVFSRLSALTARAACKLASLLRACPTRQQLQDVGSSCLNRKTLGPIVQFMGPSIPSFLSAPNFFSTNTLYRRPDPVFCCHQHQRTHRPTSTGAYDKRKREEKEAEKQGTWE